MRADYLIDKELEKILSTMNEGNSLVCQVSLHTGLRISDVLRLRMEQLKPRFWVVEQKTGKHRQVGIPEELREAIKEHNARAGGGSWCFPGADTGKHRTRQAVWRDMKRVADFYRLKVNVAPHSMRKVYAVELMKKYGDIEKVKRALNHESASVTMLYVLAAKLAEAKREKGLKPQKPFVR